MPEFTKSRDLLIGEMSRRTGVNIETIRYYERVGILPKPPRTEGGRRIYDSWHLRHLAFIKRGRELGFSLNEIRGMLTLVDAQKYTCNEIHDIAVAHQTTIKHKIADLRRLDRTLKDMIAECSKGEVLECPIVEALFGASPPADRPRA